MTREWCDKKLKEYQQDAMRIKSELFNRIKNHVELSDTCKEELQNMLVGGDGYYITTSLAEEFRIALSKNLRKSGCRDIAAYRRIYDELNVREYVGIIVKIANISRYLDSVPVEFDGDIIITDPCYIMRKRDNSTKPKWGDFFELDDYSRFTEEEKEKLGFFEKYKKLQEAESKWENEHPSDWVVCEYGDRMELLGITKSMVRDTIYGDWGCTVFDLTTKQTIGHFCADAGMVGVFQLDEVLKYNPDYDDVTNCPHCVTLIKNFKGTVQFVVKETTGTHKEDTKWWKAGDPWVDYSVHVVGKGINSTTGEPINFESSQSSL